MAVCLTLLYGLFLFLYACGEGGGEKADRVRV